jgi:uncharacterized protein YjbI with pentapeptide repeats
MTAAAEDTPWLRLARISGDHEENKRLWNGYQKYLLRPNTDEYQRQMENPKFVDIVDLSDAEIHSIQTEIPDLPKEMVWFNTISLSTGIAEIKTDLTSDGFYFAFAVFIQNTTFKGLLTLEHAQFAAGLSAIECVFENDLNAIGASFGSFTMFMECRFIERTYFQGAKFETANFDQAKFNDICAFDNAKFAGRAFFTDSIFTNSANFDSVEFHDVTSFNLAAASSAAVSLSFKDAKFFEHPPRFFGRALHEDTDWTGVKLPNAEAQAAPPRYLLEDDKRAYEQLRIKCGALGKVEDEHMFFRREMELTGRLSPWYTRATYWLYHLVSDYGYSYWRPIAGMVGVWYFWSIFYALHFMARDQLHLCMDRVELLRSAMGLSFANIFAVFGFYRRFPSDLLVDPTVVTVLLTVSETLLGFVFLFFLGLGLRTRFRLR